MLLARFRCIKRRLFSFGSLCSPPKTLRISRLIDFKGHRYEKEIILLCVRWYLAYSRIEQR